MFGKNINRTGRKALILTAAALVLAGSLIAGTVAFLKIQTDPVINEFETGTAPTPVIEETFDKTTKKNVKVTLSDDGAGSYYVRAAVIFTLQDDEGNTVAAVPANGTDYRLEPGSDWAQKEDGYWYYNKTVVPGGSTTDLIKECVTLNTQYQLVVDILVQTIQSNSADSVYDAWAQYPEASEESN